MVCLILRITRTRSKLGYGEILFYSLSNASLRVVSAEVPYLQVNPRKTYCNEVPRIVALVIVLPSCTQALFSSAQCATVVRSTMLSF